MRKNKKILVENISVENISVENIVEKSIDQSIFDVLNGYGCKFIKTVDKKNPRKENEEKFIANNIDVINKHFKSDPRHTIKVKLANNVYVLDIDAHEGSNLNLQQIDILEAHFAGLGFLTDRTPKGLHLFFLSDKPLCQKKVSRVCSLGFSCEVFPPNSLINSYKPIIRSGIPTLGDQLLLDFLTKSSTPMQPLLPGSRHDGMKMSLVKFRPNPMFHSLFNQLWCTPPLEGDKFDQLSLWSESSKINVFFVM